MKTYRCPKCGEIVRPDELIEEDDDPGDMSLLSLPPPKHLSVETVIDGISPVTTVRYKRVSPLALFFIPFTCLWGGGSISGIYGSQIIKHEFNLQLSLFGLPFLIGTIVLVSACLFMLFGKRVLTLSSGKGTYFTGVGPIGRTKRFAYGYNTKVEEDVSVCQGRRGGSSTTYFLRLTNEGDSNSVTLGSGFSKDALAYTCAVLRRECSRA